MRLPSTSSIARLHFGQVYVTSFTGSSLTCLTGLAIALTSTRPPTRRPAPRHRITLPRPFSPALGASSLSTVATTQGMQILACPARQSPLCASVRVRAMLYPPPSPASCAALGAHAPGNPLPRPLSPPAADMQLCAGYAARTAYPCRITQGMQMPQEIRVIENAFTCGYGAERRIMRFLCRID